MRLISLQSNNLAGIAYDLVNQWLFVQFTNGSWYKYMDVPEWKIIQLLFDPESQGKAFNRLIKEGGYPYVPVDGERVDAHV